MSPKQIRIENKKNLFIKWDDGSEDSISLKYLRDECPCANCKGETVLLKTFKPQRKSEQTPDMYKIKNIEQVGGYAIQITWKDGHNTGIYSWDYLKKLAASQGNKESQDYTNLL
jgi:DUF971 family protein